MSGPPPLHEERPELYGPLLAPFALSRGDRWLARLLVGLAQVPGAVRLLRLWHARRTRR